MGVQVILTGNQNAGKTTRLLSLYEQLKKKSVNVTGFAAPGTWRGETKTGFDLLDLSSGLNLPLASIYPHPDSVAFGRFFFNPKAIETGKSILRQTATRPNGMVFIDEIGKFELGGALWHDDYQQLVTCPNLSLLTVVRESLVTKIIEKFNLQNIEVFSLDTPDNTIINKLLSK